MTIAQADDRSLAIFTAIAPILGFIVSVIVLRWIIYSAVLAALRKHHGETSRDRVALRQAVQGTRSVQSTSWPVVDDRQQ